MSTTKGGTAAARALEPAEAALFRGFRFGVCENVDEVQRALDVRRQVYVASMGYQIPIPDEIDQRSWLLYAEHVERGAIVGTMRLTPRSAGPLELEEYFDLPSSAKHPHTCELSRFAIVREYRKSSTFFPSVTLGLFRLVSEMAAATGAGWLAIASKADQLWTYEWIRFERQHQTSPYGKLGSVPHELLMLHYPSQGKYPGHPFENALAGPCPREISLSDPLPALGAGIAPPRRLAAAAGAGTGAGTGDRFAGIPSISGTGMSAGS